MSSAAALAGVTDGNPRTFRLSPLPWSAPIGSSRLCPSGRCTARGSHQPWWWVSAADRVPAGPRSFAARDARAHPRAPRRRQRTGHANADDRLCDRQRPGWWVAYADRPLPADRHSRLQTNSAFDDLNYAFYLGRRARSADLLVTDVPELPLRGAAATDVVAFGDSALTLVVTPNGSLGGTFFEDLPWLIVVIGVSRPRGAPDDRPARSPAPAGRGARGCSTRRRGEPPPLRRAARYRADPPARAAAGEAARARRAPASVRYRAGHLGHRRRR